MAERGRYKTKQQALILECLKKQKFRFLTVSQFMDCLREKGVVVGQTTVYRVLERMVDDEASDGGWYQSTLLFCR